MKLTQTQKESMQRVAEILEAEEMRNQAVILKENQVFVSNFKKIEKPRWNFPRFSKD